MQKFVYKLALILFIILNLFAYCEIDSQIIYGRELFQFSAEQSNVQPLIIINICKANDCIGTRSFDQFGEYISYPDGCDPQWTKYLNSCFKICGRNQENDIDALSKTCEFGSKRWKDTITEIDSKWEKCLRNCRDRIGISL